MRFLFSHTAKPLRKETMMRTFSLGLTAAVLLFAACASIARTAGAGEVKKHGTTNSGQEYIAVTRVFDRYINALRLGSSDELKQIYLPHANFYFFREGKLVGGPIEILYKSVEGNPIHRPVVYSVTSVEVSGRIASLTLDIADLDGVHILDMFTLVQDDTGEWKIASKVARRP